MTPPFVSYDRAEVFAQAVPYPLHALGAANPPFSPEWSFVTLELTRTDPLPERKIFRNHIADWFRETAVTFLPPQLRAYILRAQGGWQIHHIIPLSLGGSNQFLSLAPANVHKWIHNFVCSQTEQLEIGQSMPVTIPWRDGLLWPNQNLDFYRNQLASHPLPRPKRHDGPLPLRLPPQPPRPATAQAFVG